MQTKQGQRSQHSKKKNNGLAVSSNSNAKKRKKQQHPNNDSEPDHGDANDPGYHLLRLQAALLSPDYILKKVFRKDGPTLGVEFDSLPSPAFHLRKKAHPDSRKSHLACQERRTLKRRKVSKSTVLDYQVGNENIAPVKKHGIGKGLMTVWRVMNPGAGDCPTGVDFVDKSVPHAPNSIFPGPLIQEKKIRVQRRQPVTRKLKTKSQDKRKPLVRSKKVACKRIEKPKQPSKDKCELALENGGCLEDRDLFGMLMDDEELELSELQSGPNPLTCSAHFTSNGMHSCSLCKDLLHKFPPASVVMKTPLSRQPWDSSPELVKKLFKVLHFLYTYAVTIDICSFNLDDFAEAFHDKDSLLLGKVHVALLKLLLSDVKAELSSGLSPYSSKNCKFLELLHSLEHQEPVLNFWLESVNPLTWTEISRQVLVASGFGLKKGTLAQACLNKEVNPMMRYGLTPGSLKGELFTILLTNGNNGLKVSELAKFSKIVELNLAATTDGLELIINSMLSSDITLFEKISSSAYRLRINSLSKEPEKLQSDSEDFGSVDDNSKDRYEYNSSADSEDDLGASSCSKLDQSNHLYSEIDESHPGEAWLLGLMDGDYSDLSIEEKLDALIALLDLLSAGSSIRMEDAVASIAEHAPNTSHHGSGAKIKRSSTTHPRSFGGHLANMLGNRGGSMTSVLHPVDTLAYISKSCCVGKSFSCWKDAKEADDDNNLHPMQSIYLGSDRRYNRYWLLLGPCNAQDPGHKRIYFESSEDGHWEVIDTEEAMCALLSALDSRGTREAYLQVSLEKRESILCQAMSALHSHNAVMQTTSSDQSELIMSREDSLSAVSEVDNLSMTEIQIDLPTASLSCGTGKRGEQLKEKLSHIQAFDAWIWNKFYFDLNAVKHTKRSYHDSLARCEHCHDLYWRDEKHCKICHTTFELDFDLEERYTIHAATCSENTETDQFPKHKILPSSLQLLKAAIYAVESVMPDEAFVGAWKKSAHNLWVRRLRRTSTLAEFLQVLTDFVSVINGDWLYNRSISVGSNSGVEEIIGSFQTMPQTISAVALWVVKLDALIAPYLERVCSHKKQEIRVGSNRGERSCRR